MTVGKFLAVVTDIEGTTTPISFVHDELFPYVLTNLTAFLESNWEDAQVQFVIEKLATLAANDAKEGVEGCVLISLEGNRGQVIESIFQNIKYQMSLNRKVGPLKELQGLLWKSGYESGMLKGIVYDDVVVALQSWKRLGIKVHVYSSGSIAAQKLLFGYSNQGSLLEYFEHHFDTNIGSKLESSSYTKISNEIKVSPADALFLSDNINECLRAREAGFQVVNVNRPGNAAIPDLFGIKQIDSFAKLFE